MQVAHTPAGNVQSGRPSETLMHRNATCGLDRTSMPSRPSKTQPISRTLGRNTPQDKQEMRLLFPAHLTWSCSRSSASPGKPAPSAAA